jgi:hypothetical protein
MWASVVNGGYSVEQTMVVEWPLVHWSHAGCYGQQHGWFYVNDDDDDEVILGRGWSLQLLHVSGLRAAMLPFVVSCSKAELLDTTG